MEGEHHYELRSRSRSRSHTPMIINQSVTDSEFIGFDLRSKESRERSHTPAEVSSSRRSNSRSLSGSVQKSKDKGMESIVEKTEVIQSETVQENENQHDDNNLSAPPVIKKIERRSERQRVKRQILINGQGESKDNAVLIEDLTEKQPQQQNQNQQQPQPQQQQQQQQQQKQRKSLTPSRTVTSDYSSEEGERDDLPSRPGSAYEIYKQAGDWWNVFPKTDYTYSRASQCRYEIAPGVLAMPNMSRPSIHSDNSSVLSFNSLSQQTNELTQSSQTISDHTDSSLNGEITDTIEQNRVNEENARLFGYSMNSDSNARLIYKQSHVEKRSHRREIFYNDFNITRNRFGSLSNFDSDTELDEAVSLRSSDERWKIVKWFEKLKCLVIFLIANVFEFINVKILRKKSEISSHHYHRYRESKWMKIWTKIDHALQYLYLLLIRVLYLDSWLLSRITNIRKHFPARHSKIFWLILLPPLLLAGCWLLPYGFSLTFSHFTDVLSQQMKDGDIFGSFYQPVVDVKREIDVKSHEEINENLRQAIERLVNRVDKLEAAGNNKQELITNISQSIVELQSNEKNTWKYYETKLENLEARINANDNNENTQNEINNIKLEFNNLQQNYQTLKTCCDKNNIQLFNTNIERHVEKIFSEYFGSGITKTEINKIVENLIVANNNVATNDNSVILNCNEKNDEDQLSITDGHIEKIVKEILKIYDADKTGRVDYALESAGGQIISIRCTQRYNVNTRAFKVLGFTLFYESGDPRTVIQGRTLQPGVCWAFQDFPGYLLIKLRSFIKVTGFTMEHAPKSILPNNEMRSAPRKFNVWGLKEENDMEPILFGEYEFLESDESLQYFPVQNENITDLYEYIELRIHSNHGQFEYTCLYRFRVHGIPG